MVNTRRVYVLTIILVGLLLSTSSAAGVEKLASRDLNLVGDAYLIADGVRINQAELDVCGAFWYAEQVAVQDGFITEFRFAITDQGGWDHPSEGTNGADGFAFVVQNFTDDAIGWGQCHLGYAGIPNSIAIEFDTWLNSEGGGGEFGEPDGHHISVQTCGTAPNSAHHDFSLGCISYPELVTVEEHLARIKYEPGSLEIYVDDLSNPIFTVSVNLADLLVLNDGRAWFGFTGATGLAWENHDILGWSIGETPVATTRLTWGGVKSLYK